MKFFLALAFLFSLPALAQITYEGTSGPEKGKHIVFVASDHEYRAEETCPALARILAKHHGFKTTVLFGVNEKGEITAGASNIKCLEALKDADLMFIFARFLDLPDDQMVHIDEYLNRGGPVVGLRTSSHAFKIPKGKKYSRYDFQYKGKEFDRGFGHQILGNTWVGHYGKNHRQATRIQIIPKNKDHLILTGVGNNAHTIAGAYTGIPDDTFTVLTESQPLDGMEKGSPADKTKKPSPSTWTRHYTSKSGKKARVFHSTQGASEDLLDPDYRRLIINGTYWAMGLEKEIKADSKVDLIGPYKPTTFRNGGHVRGLKPEVYQDINSPIPGKGNPPPVNDRRKKATKKPAKKTTAKPKDAKNSKLDRKAPPKDPDLAKYYINLKTSPRPPKAQPVKTKLPLEIAPGTRIALIGNLLLDAERRYGHLETLLHQHHPNHKLTVRNLAWPADEVDLMPRPDNFGDLDQHLHYFKADLIIAAYGYNESFAGKEGLPAFKERLDKFLTHLKSHAYNGKSAPRIILLAPMLNSNFEGSNPDHQSYLNLTSYAKAMAEISDDHQIGFVDILKQPLEINYDNHGSYFPRTASNLTTDGHALNEEGHATFSNATFKALFDKDPTAINEDLRQLVVDKATQFFYRYRPLNTFYYTGGRNKSYGYLDFLPAMRSFDLMVANRDKAIHETVVSGKLVKPDDSNLPKMDDVLLSRGANKFLSPADELKAFKIDPRFEVNCFASEEDFPEMACPIQMRWDKHGRLWVSTSVTYPHVYPGQKPCDKIIILEDTDQDGKADKCTTWADDLHIPLSFVLDGNGGVFCSEEPHLTHLTDTDGDGKMDTREILFTGFGCEDSHHALHDFTWTPGGDLLFREAIFHNTQTETAYGPIRAKNSSWFLYHPSNRKLTAFGAYPNTNPWGVTFDPWGNHVASHPVFASTFHATNPDYPTQHPGAKGMQAYSGVCGQDFVSHDFWPKEMQGGFIKVRYKPTNRVEFHQWNQETDHFSEKYQFDLIFSTNLSFIPVDFKFGPRGAAYVCDWYNPVKGHAQYSLRDPRRDRKAGRIWRIIPKGAKLDSAPRIAKASVEELFDHLKSPHYRTRYWAKRELRARFKNPSKFYYSAIPPRETILKTLPKWTSQQDNPLHLLEALWLHQAFDLPNLELLETIINGEDPLAVASAFGPLRFWANQLQPQHTLSLIKLGVNHPSQHVRREAILCASYLLPSHSNRTPSPIPADDLISLITPILDYPADTHLAYAITTALNSSALKPHWQNSPQAEAITSALSSFKKSSRLKPTTRGATEAAFDSQKGLQTIEISCIPERLLFTKEKFTVKAGQPVRLHFSNPDVTEHNLLILDENAPVQEIGEAANRMAADPEAAKKGFIPNDKRILHATKLLKKDTVETLRFIAPKKPGKYPYLCSYPGHWTIMRGVMIVK